MNKKNILLTLILIIIFASVSILAIIETKKIIHVHVNAINAPDFAMTNAIYTKFDQNGNISDQFYTTRITHFITNNNYIFDNPRIKMYNNKEQPWEITADKGKSEGGKSKIYLWNNVKLIQASTSNSGSHKPTFEIYTTSLTLYPTAKLAETNDYVTIIQGDSIIKSLGAKADFKSGTLNLLSTVECQHQNSTTT
jgi:LPS export ABC transporter protein LptC